MVSYIVGGQSPGGRQVPEHVHDKREATVTKGLADPPAMCLIFFYRVVEPTMAMSSDLRW